MSRKRLGLRIVWPQAIGESEPALRVEYVPRDRDVFLIWRDRFGVLHGAGWGPHVSTNTKRFDKAVNSAGKILGLWTDDIHERTADERLR